MIDITEIVSFILGSLLGSGGIIVYMKRKSRKKMEELEDVIEDMGDMDGT